MKIIIKIFKEVYIVLVSIFKDIPGLIKYNINKYLDKSTYDDIDSFEDFQDAQYYS